MVIHRFIVSYGPYFARVVLSSIFIMAVGFAIFYIGYMQLDNMVLVFPPERFFYPAPNSLYTEKKVVYSEVIGISYNNAHIERTIEMNTTGYITINVEHPSYSLSTVYIVVEYASYPPLGKIFEPFFGRTGFKTLYSIESHGHSEKYIIPINKPGYYRIKIVGYLAFAQTITITITVTEIRDKPNVVFSKWLQFVGLMVFIFGLGMFAFAPLIASRHAHSTYLVTPSHIREELAKTGVFQLMSEERKKHK